MKIKKLLHYYSEIMDREGAQGFLERFKGSWKRQMEEYIKKLCDNQDSNSSC
jgi:hypothetical protein